MQSEARHVKIIFTDNGTDKAVTGILASQDDYFFYLNGYNGKRYTIGKKAVVSLEEVRA